MTRTSSGGMRALTRAGILLVGLAFTACGAPPPAASKPPVSARPSNAPASHIPLAEVTATIERDVGLPDSDGQVVSAGQRELARLYVPGGFAPLWIDAAGRPSANARAALALVAGAAADGLDPADYRVVDLEARANTLGKMQPLPGLEVAGFDVGLSRSILRYLRHLHIGRVNPRTVGFRMAVPADDHDFAAILLSALAGERIAETAAEWAPPLSQYRSLRTLLHRYRSLAADTTLPSLPPPSAAVRPGEPYVGLVAVHRRLVAFGDLPADAAPLRSSGAYDGILVEGVKRFQARHGLASDGVLGRATQAALNVPLMWRVRQLELALERLRWLPHLGGRRLIGINIPMFRLWAWDAMPQSSAPSLSMGVIVGRALDTRTPVFAEEMPYLIFRPYWNIPPSILREETIPLIERDPEYLRRQDMEIVSGQGDDARPVDVSAENLARLRRGLLRVRQRPGLKNSLGLVKFMFPNDDNVYLHGTPARELFGRPRRDFSHGCVRVEDPVALATWALAGQPEWTPERILAAMNGTETTRVDLARPVQVILFYITAAVMPEDGSLRFAEDIYGHDQTLDRALTRQPRTK